MQHQLQIGKREMCAFVERHTRRKVTDFTELQDGQVFCMLLNLVFPRARVQVNTKQMMSATQVAKANWSLLHRALKSLKIPQDFFVRKLVQKGDQLHCFSALALFYFMYHLSRQTDFSAEFSLDVSDELTDFLQSMGSVETLVIGGAISLQSIPEPMRTELEERMAAESASEDEDEEEEQARGASLQSAQSTSESRRSSHSPELRHQQEHDQDEADYHHPLRREATASYSPPQRPPSMFRDEVSPSPPCPQGKFPDGATHEDAAASPSPSRSTSVRSEDFVMESTRRPNGARFSQTTRQPAQHVRPQDSAVAMEDFSVVERNILSDGLGHGDGVPQQESDSPPNRRKTMVAQSASPPSSISSSPASQQEDVMALRNVVTRLRDTNAALAADVEESSNEVVRLGEELGFKTNEVEELKSRSVRLLEQLADQRKELFKTKQLLTDRDAEVEELKEKHQVLLDAQELNGSSFMMSPGGASISPLSFRGAGHHAYLQGEVDRLQAALKEAQSRNRKLEDDLLAVSSSKTAAVTSSKHNIGGGASPVPAEPTAATKPLTTTVSPSLSREVTPAGQVMASSSAVATPLVEIVAQAVSTAAESAGVVVVPNTEIKCAVTDRTPQTIRKMYEHQLAEASITDGSNNAVRPQAVKIDCHQLADALHEELRSNPSVGESASEKLWMIVSAYHALESRIQSAAPLLTSLLTEKRELLSFVSEQQSTLEAIEQERKQLEAQLLEVQQATNQQQGVFNAQISEVVATAKQWRDEQAKQLQGVEKRMGQYLHHASDNGSHPDASNNGDDHAIIGLLKTHVDQYVRREEDWRALVVMLRKVSHLTLQVALADDAEVAKQLATDREQAEVEAESLAALIVGAVDKQAQEQRALQRRIQAFEARKAAPSPQHNGFANDVAEAKEHLMKETIAARHIAEAKLAEMEEQYIRTKGEIVAAKASLHNEQHAKQAAEALLAEIKREKVQTVDKFSQQLVQSKLRLGEAESQVASLTQRLYEAEGIWSIDMPHSEQQQPQPTVHVYTSPKATTSKLYPNDVPSPHYPSKPHQLAEVASTPSAHQQRIPFSDSTAKSMKDAVSERFFSATSPLAV